MRPPLPAEGDDARFNAEVDVELTNSVTGELIWSGSLSREHYMTDDSYMHEAPARSAMKNALRSLFADYPGPDSQEYR